jgi:hypothetical protein
MARDSLRILLAMRRRSVEQARYVLGACLVAEAGVADTIRSLDDTVRRDRETSGTWPGAHQFLEMSASRQESIDAERGVLAVDLAAAEVRSMEARGVVSAARMTAEAAEQLIGEREAAIRFESDRREQHVADDIARARLTGRPRHQPP